MKQFTKFTPKKQVRFLERLALGWSVTDAARAAGVEPRTAYNHREPQQPEYEPAFADAWEAALEAGTQVLEDEARRRAVDGTVIETPLLYRGAVAGKIVERKYSDTLLIFLLKARRPDKYRENVAHQHSGTISHHHAHDLARLSDRDLEELERLVDKASMDGRGN